MGTIIDQSGAAYGLAPWLVLIESLRQKHLQQPVCVDRTAVGRAAARKRNARCRDQNRDAILAQISKAGKRGTSTTALAEATGVSEETARTHAKFHLAAGRIEIMKTVGKQVFWRIEK